jgi:hypothetical protein
MMDKDNDGMPYVQKKMGRITVKSDPAQGGALLGGAGGD